MAAQVRYVAQKLELEHDSAELEQLTRVCDEMNATICRVGRNSARAQGEAGEGNEMAVSFQVLDELIREGVKGWLDDEGRLRKTLKGLIEGGPPRLVSQDNPTR